MADIRLNHHIPDLLAVPGGKTKVQNYPLGYLQQGVHQRVGTYRLGNNTVRQLLYWADLDGVLYQVNLNNGDKHVIYHQVSLADIAYNQK